MTYVVNLALKHWGDLEWEVPNYCAGFDTLFYKSLREQRQSV